jgi:hypothetical protein
MKKMRFFIGLLLLTISTFTYSQGSNCSIPQQCLASAPSELAMKDLNKVCNAKDENALKSLIANSQAFVLDANTKVIIIKRYFATSDIKVLSGNNKGEKMRIANEYLNCK